MTKSGSPAESPQGPKLRKATQACDRCRSKKLRCEVEVSSVDQQERLCTNCQAGGAACLWTREPKKRGPQKGFQKARQSSVSNSDGSPRDESASKHEYYHKPVNGSPAPASFATQARTAYPPQQLQQPQQHAPSGSRQPQLHAQPQPPPRLLYGSSPVHSLPSPMHQQQHPGIQPQQLQPQLARHRSLVQQPSQVSHGGPSSGVGLGMPAGASPISDISPLHHAIASGQRGSLSMYRAPGYEPASGSPGAGAASVPVPAPFEPDVSTHWSRSPSGMTHVAAPSPTLPQDAMGSQPYGNSGPRRSIGSGQSHPSPVFNQLPRLGPMNLAPPSLPPPPSASTMTRVPWLSEAFERWYLLNQPTFPILDTDVDQLRDRLDRGHPRLREALMLALYSVAHRGRTASKRDMLDAEINLAEFRTSLRAAAPDPGVDPIQEKITCLQVCMLLAIEADQRGLEACPTVGVWLSRSVAQAYDLRLHTDDFDHPRLLLLGKRLWYTLIILDRWHSVSASSPPFITEYGVRMSPPERDVLGTLPTYLYRLSGIVAHVYAFQISSSAQYGDVGAAGDEEIRRRVDSELDTFRQDVEVVWGQMNLLNIAFWHISLLSCLSAAPQHVDVQRLKDLSTRMASTLPSSATPYTPLNHHFFSLTACVLAQLAQRREMADDVARATASLIDAVEKHRDLVTGDGQDWDEAILRGLKHAQTGKRRPTVALADGSLLAHIRRWGYLRSFCLDFSR